MEKVDNITCVSEEEVLEKIGIIMRQTNYDSEESKKKLLLANMNHITVIKEYFGITETKKPPIKSIQQQIYKEIRYHLDDSIRDFNDKQEQKLKADIENNN